MSRQHRRKIGTFLLKGYGSRPLSQRLRQPGNDNPREHRYRRRNPTDDHIARGTERGEDTAGKGIAPPPAVSLG
jgi:hypothetical protein